MMWFVMGPSRIMVVVLWVTTTSVAHLFQHFHRIQIPAYTFCYLHCYMVSSIHPEHLQGETDLIEGKMNKIIKTVWVTLVVILESHAKHCCSWVWNSVKCLLADWLARWDLEQPPQQVGDAAALPSQVKWSKPYGEASVNLRPNIQNMGTGSIARTYQWSLHVSFWSRQSSECRCWSSMPSLAFCFVWPVFARFPIQP